MRISTSYEFNNSTSWIDSAYQTMSTAQTRVSSGKAFQSISEDPYAATQSLRMQSVLDDISQYASNITTVKTSLSTSQSALTQINGLLTQLNQIAVSASNSSTGQDAMTAYANQVDTIQGQLVSLANTQGADGQYIFAGQKNSQAPFTVANGALTFNGDKNNVTAQVGPSSTMASNTDISEAMTSLYSQLEAFKDDLRSGNVKAISNTDLANIKSTTDQFTQTGGAVGVNLSTLTTLSTQNSQRKLDVTSQLSNTQDVDLSSAITQLQAAQTAYQAALSVASVGFKTSLLNYL